MSEDLKVVLTHIEYIREDIKKVHKILEKQNSKMDNLSARTEDQETRITVIAGQIPEIKEEAKSAAKTAGGIIGAALAAIVTAIGAIILIVWRKI